MYCLGLDSLILKIVKKKRFFFNLKKRRKNKAIHKLCDEQYIQEV